MGIALEADTAESIFDTKGIVWLTAAFDVDNQSKRIVLEKFDLYTKTDNAPVDLLAATVRSEIVNRKVRAALEVDFSRQWNDAIGKANSALRRQLSGDIYLDGRLSDLTVDRITAGPHGLVLIMRASGNVHLGSGELPGSSDR